MDIQLHTENNTTQTEAIPYTGGEAVTKAGGNSSKLFFYIGAIGLILLVIGIFMASTIGNHFFNIAYLYYGLLDDYIVPLGTAGYILILIGVILTALGFYAYRRNYGVGLGRITLVLVLIFGWWLPAADFLLYTRQVLVYEEVVPTIFTWLLGPLGPYWLIFNVVGSVFVGVFCFLWASVMITGRRHTGRVSISIAAGILFVLSGICFVSIIGFNIGAWIFIIGGILGIIVLLTAKL